PQPYLLSICMLRRPPLSTLFPTRRSSDLRPMAIRCSSASSPSASSPAASSGSSTGPAASPSPSTPTPSTTSTSCSSADPNSASRSEEHTSELQSQSNLVCRLLLEKKKDNHNIRNAEYYVMILFIMIGMLLMPTSVERFLLLISL